MSVEYFAALICAWLATYFIHSTLMLGAVWVATRRLSSRFDRIAELMWRTSLAMPILTSVGQQLLSATFVAGSASLGAIEYTPPALPTSRTPTAFWIGVTSIWILVALFGLVHLCWCRWALRRQIERGTPLPSDRLQRLTDIEGVEWTQISVVTRLTVPFALSREVCLPAWMVDRLTSAELRAVVAHELAHVRRHDAFWRAAISALARSFFFQPLNWLAVRRLRELSECICDDEALSATKSPIPLAAALETVATRVHRRRAHLSVAPAMGAPMSLTLRRVERILSQPRVSRSGLNVGRGRLVSMTVGAALLAVLLAPRVTMPDIAFMRYTINAMDPAGPFTITLEKGRVVDATLGGRKLDRRQLRQNGSHLELADGTRVLALQMTPEGGITWSPRKRIVQNR